MYYVQYLVLNILERVLIRKSLADKLIIILNTQADPMTKYNKVYLRNKKESNISLPLRYSFLQSIFVDNMTVKEVSLPLYRPLWSGRFTTPLLKSLLGLPSGINFTPSFKNKRWIVGPRYRAHTNRSMRPCLDIHLILIWRKNRPPVTVIALLTFLSVKPLRSKFTALLDGTTTLKVSFHLIEWYYLCFLFRTLFFFARNCYRWQIAYIRACNLLPSLFGYGNNLAWHIDRWIYFLFRLAILIFSSVGFCPKVHHVLELISKLS